jgi:hypothetical protein
MGEYSLRLRQLALPRRLFKPVTPYMALAFYKTKHPLRYSLLYFGFTLWLPSLEIANYAFLQCRLSPLLYYFLPEEVNLGRY